MNDSGLSTTRMSNLRDHWEALRTVRESVAAELDEMTVDFPGSRGTQLRELSEWFRGPAEFDSALERPEVLAICLRLIQPKFDSGSRLDASSPSDDGAKMTIDSSSIPSATRMGYCESIARPISARHQLARMLLYPIIILLAAWIVWIGFSFWLAPQFDDLFDEFQISLPRITEIVLGMARFIRRWWWLMIGMPSGFIGLYWFLNRPDSKRRSRNSSWLDSQLLGMRHALGNWAWHLSLLLESGVTENIAVAVAGANSDKSWIRQLSSQWVSQNVVHHDPAAPRYERDKIVKFLSPRKFQLLNAVMDLPVSPTKAALLRELANYYWERSRTIGDWWVHWLVSFIIWSVAALAVIIVLSIFMPLFAILGGLTGMK